LGCGLGESVERLRRNSLAREQVARLLVAAADVAPDAAPCFLQAVQAVSSHGGPSSR
jgi:hypothetical protein